MVKIWNGENIRRVAANLRKDKTLNRLAKTATSSQSRDILNL